jgi:hypothetical protein
MVRICIQRSAVQANRSRVFIRQYIYPYVKQETIVDFIESSLLKLSVIFPDFLEN